MCFRRPELGLSFRASGYDCAFFSRILYLLGAIQQNNSGKALQEAAKVRLFYGLFW